MHGGAFMTCGVNSHSRISVALSKFADSPVLVVDYRLIPKHTIGMAIDDCYDGYRWLRLRGYEPDQIVLAGDSAGGYLAMSLAQRLQAEGETLPRWSRSLHCCNSSRIPSWPPERLQRRDVPAKAFDALVALVAGRLPTTSSTACPRTCTNRWTTSPRPAADPDPRLRFGDPAARRTGRRTPVGRCGVPTQVRVWPGQIHDFQLAEPLIPEATRSLRQIGEYIREATG